MSEFFLKVVNMSISASWLVLAVLILRLVLKKAPKWVSVLLWGFVAIRLICPFSIESILSLIPSAETISPEIMMDATPEIHTGISSLNSVINPIVSEFFAPDPLVSMNPLQLWIPLAAVAWLAGIAAMLIYTAVSYILLRRKVVTAVLLRNNICQSENVDSPFVLGIIKPKIYLPFQMDGENLEYVIAHEESHIRRKDHWWKPLGFLLLTLHWFNPLMWIGYILLCRDIELACDEKVIKEMDNESKADYTQALVACSVNRRSIAACPLAFGEVGVKQRVKSVMNYRKPAFWVIVAAIIVCGVVAVCFLTNPKDSSSGALPNIYSHAYVVEEVTFEGGMYSFTVIAGENSPIYAITEDMTLVSQKEVSEEGIWAQLGKLEVTELTKDNFDDLFKTPGNWADNISAKGIRNNTKAAWQLIYNQDVLYYVLQQKNGDLFLAYGYTGFSNNDANYAHIRWLYKLAIDTTGMSGMVAKSGDGTVPMVSFPKGTMIKDYVGSVYWLTINPDDEESVPFSVWKDGEEVRGFYNAYDAETFEPIKHFIPSGLDPQTYLFQNADPSRRYIVLATFSTESDAEIYAFGARFDSTISSVGGADAPTDTTEIIWDLIPMIRVDGTLYLDTGFNSSVEGRCGVMDGEISSQVSGSERPTVDNQSNFGTGYGYQYGTIAGTIDLYMNGNWRIFATEQVRQQLQFSNQHTIVDEVDKAISNAILEKNAGDTFLNKPTGLIPVEAHYMLGIVSVSGTPLAGQTNHMEEVIVYIQYAYHRYSNSNGKLERVAGTGSPAKLTFTKNENGGYTLKEFWEPNNGSLYAEDIRKMFPADIADMVLNPENDVINTEELEAKCLIKAQEHVYKLLGLSSQAQDID